MSDLDRLTDSDLAVERETAKEPAKRWVNWSWAIGAGWYECGFCNRTLYAADGELVGTHCRTFPSKDVAESYAFDDLASNPKVAEEWDYLGAYPEGERP